MAEYSRFFDHIDGDRTYNADEFAEYFRQILTTGVLDTGDNLQVYVTGADRIARIKPGKAWIEGYFYKLTEELQLPLDEAHGTYDRIDRIVLRLDTNTEARNIKTLVKTGMPATEPVAPTLIRTGNIYEISLAQILVVHNTTSIPTGNVTDERLDSAVCGLANMALTYEEFALKIDTGDINDDILPIGLKGKPLTEQILYVLENAGQVKSVNNKTGEVTLTYTDVGAVPVGRTINGKPLSSNISLTKSDIGLGNVDNVKQVPTTRTVNGKALTNDIVVDIPDIAGLNSALITIGSNISLSSPPTTGFVLGRNVFSLGEESVAIGRYVNAGGNKSVALGTNANASNDYEGILGMSSEGYGPAKWIVPGSFTVKGTKNFEIPHPKPEKSATHVIRHAAVESPTPGDTLYRYKITATKENDLVTIDLPDYFIWLNKDVQIFVTPQGHFSNGYGVLNRETEQLEIHCQHEGQYNVLVIGTRNDEHQSVQDWNIKGVEREIGESWTGETYVFEVDEIMEVEEIKEVV